MPDYIKQIFMRAYAERDPWVHKGDFGYVLIIAGSQKYSGSPVFNAMGALRVGADVAVVRGAARAIDIAAAYAPDIITEPLLGDFHSEVVQKVIAEVRGYQALVIGCGLERNEASFYAMREIMLGAGILPMVLDAEALRALVGHTDVVRGKQMVLTPNSEEFYLLTGERVGTNEDERKEKVRTWAAKLGTTILLKGHVDIVSDGERVFVNTTGSPLMTKGGFGDVLSGVLGALLARNTPPFDAACLAAYLNGRAGELAAEKYGEGILASDMLIEIPVVLNAMKHA